MYCYYKTKQLQSSTGLWTKTIIINHLSEFIDKLSRFLLPFEIRLEPYRQQVPCIPTRTNIIYTLSEPRLRYSVSKAPFKCFQNKYILICTAVVEKENYRQCIKSKNLVKTSCFIILHHKNAYLIKSRRFLCNPYSAAIISHNNLIYLLNE